MLLRLRKDHDELTDNFVEVADQRNEVAKQLQETLANWKETTALLERTSTDYKNWKEEDKEWRKTFGNRVIELVSPLLDKEAVEKLKHLIYDTKPKADLQ